MKYDFITSRRYFLLSLCLHLLLILVLVVNFQKKHAVRKQSVKQMTQEPVSIVQAVAIDETVIQAEIKRLEKQDRAVSASRKHQQRQLEKEKKAVQKAARLAKKQANQARIEQEKLKKAQKATEKLKKEALAAQRVAEKMKAQLLKEKQAAAEAKKRAEKQRAQKLAQELAQKRAQEQASAIQRQVNEYLAYIVEKIEGSRQFMLHLAPDLLVDVSFLLLPDGSIKNLVIQKSSGSTPYDESALMAVRKAAPFDNMPDAPEVLKHLNRVMTFGFKNEHNM